MVSCLHPGNRWFPGCRQDTNRLQRQPVPPEFSRRVEKGSSTPGCTRSGSRWPTVAQFHSRSHGFLSLWSNTNQRMHMWPCLKHQLSGEAWILLCCACAGAPHRWTMPQMVRQSIWACPVPHHTPPEARPSLDALPSLPSRCLQLARPTPQRPLGPGYLTHGAQSSTGCAVHQR